VRARWQRALAPVSTLRHPLDPSDAIGGQLALRCGFCTFDAISTEICAWIRSRFAPPWFFVTFSRSRAIVSAGVFVAGWPS